MKQLFQSYGDGELRLVEVPTCLPGRGQVLVRTVSSLVSVGTERYMLEMAQKSLLGKALARPDLVRGVVAKAQSEGILEAYRQAKGRLDAPLPLGYSSAGIVITGVGGGVEHFVAGDRVACAGSGYASHAEAVSVPANLCVKIPESVDFDAAAFVALGGIALEAVRLARVCVGEQVLVIGLGLLGQIAVQLLNAAGCHVLGLDVSSSKAQLARQHGSEAVASDYDTLAGICRRQTGGHGADAVLIFAATSSNEPLERAAELCRERGRIVAAGLVGLDIPRKPFYDKELELVVSRAWGPGLYDPQYVEKGVDYPLAYARWTAGRNMAEFLAQVAKGSVRVDYLITHRFPIERAGEAYELITGRTREPILGVLLTYPESPDLCRRVEIRPQGERRKSAFSNWGLGLRTQRVQVSVGLIGAGQFARGTLLPALRRVSGLDLRGVAAASGLSARHVGEKFSFAYCTTDYQEILKDPGVDSVLIATRHHLHASMAIEALRAGKHVFVEKPLALTLEELLALEEAYGEASRSGTFLVVGFNRRFSPFTTWVREQMGQAVGPAVIHCRVNAGPIPRNHWSLDRVEGGGRILGEVCHFVDLIQALTGALPVRVHAEALSGREDDLAATLRLSDGSVGSILYTASGDKAFARERVELFRDGAVAVIENFKRASVTRRGRTRRMRRLFVDRGHQAELMAFFEAVRQGGPPPISFDEYRATTLATFAIETALQKGQPVDVALEALLSREGEKTGLPKAPREA